MRTRHLVVTALLVGLAGVAQAANLETGAMASPDLGVIRARGPAASARAPNARRLLQLRRIATVRAQRDLLAYIKGIHIDSNTTFSDLLDSEDYGEVVKTHVEGTLKRARMVREGQVEGALNVYEVVMEIDTEGIRRSTVVNEKADKAASDDPYAIDRIILPTTNYSDLGEATRPPPMTPDFPVTPVTPDAPVAPVTPVAPVAPVAPATPETPYNPQLGLDPTSGNLSEHVASDELAAALYGETPPPPPVKTTAAPPVARGAWTGVIVDATGLNADRALWPRILGPGNDVIYGKFDLTTDFLYKEGAVHYAESLSEARSLGRAGNRPLVVEATGTEGAYKADLVVDAAGAAKLAGATDALSKYRVVFMIPPVGQ